MLASTCWSDGSRSALRPSARAWTLSVVRFPVRVVVGLDEVECVSQAIVREPREPHPRATVCLLRVVLLRVPAAVAAAGHAPFDDAVTAALRGADFVAALLHGPAPLDHALHDAGSQFGSLSTSTTSSASLSVFCNSETTREPSA